ncbi:LysR family transcriptional regulator [Methylibium petroleiphilum]|nr:LysR family transcriptional regulator [Methylibium petroleiphilum]
MVTLRQLELLVAMSEARSMSGGGARIGMSASATSHALKALESQLGVAVVDRQARVFALTDAGQRVLRHAHDVFTSLKTIDQEGKAAAGLKTGVLRIGSFGASSSIRLLPVLIDRYRALYPGVEVFVLEDPDQGVERGLTEGRLDLGVVALPRPDFDTQLLAVDDLVAVLPQGHPLAHHERVDLRDLVKYPFIMTHAGSQGLVKRLFDRCGLAPRITHELAQLWSILDFVSRGQGVSIVAALAVPQDFPGIVVRPVVPRAQRRIGLACRDEHRLSLPGRAMWRLARGALQKPAR